MFRQLQSQRHAASSLFTSKQGAESKSRPSWNVVRQFGVHNAHLHVLIRNFIVHPGVSGSTTGGCGPPTIREERKGDVIALVSVLDVTSGSQRCHSQEGMPHSVTDVCYGFHVHTVVMQ